MALTLTDSLPGSSFATFEVGDSTCFAQLGFVKGQAGTAGVLEATSAINLHQTLNTYVRANMKVDNLDYPREQKGVIAKIQVAKDVGGIVHHRNIEDSEFQLNGTFLDNLKTVLLGDDGDRIDSSGLEYHLAVAFFIRNKRGDINAATLRSKVGK